MTQKNLSCHNCGKRFATINALNRHFKITKHNHGEKLDVTKIGIKKEHLLILMPILL